MEQDDTNTEVSFCDEDTGRILDDDDRSECFLCDKPRKMLACRPDELRFRTSANNQSSSLVRNDSELEWHEGYYREYFEL
jgi:hypothetical protein